MRRLTQNYRCVTGLAHHVTWVAQTSASTDHVTFKDLNAARQICKTSAYEGTAMLAGLCGRKCYWKTSSEERVTVNQNMFHMIHAGGGASLRVRANVVTSLGLVENRKKTDDNIISVSVTLSFWAPRKAVWRLFSLRHKLQVIFQ